MELGLRYEVREFIWCKVLNVTD